MWIARNVAELKAELNRLETQKGIIEYYFQCYPFGLILPKSELELVHELDLLNLGIAQLRKRLIFLNAL